MKIFSSNTAKIIVFLSLFGFTLDASAQKINDDLQQPKTTPKKTVKTTPTTKKKPVAKTTKKPKVSTTPVPVPVTTQPTTVTQTPAEIIKRFMNFQQSASVTVSDWESVVTQTNAALQSNPNDTTIKAQLFVAQGQLAFMRGDFSNALIQFNAAADVLPASALPQYGIGKVYLATKQPNEAENAFERAIKNDKNFALAYKGVGDALTAQGKVKKAQEYYKDAAQIGLTSGNGVVANTNPAQNTQPNVQTPNTQPLKPYENELNEAKKLTVRKKWQASLDKLNELAKTYPTADIYLAIGENYIGMQQLLSAQQAFRKATEVSPTSAIAFVKLGSVLSDLNEYQAAYESFEKALILDQQGATINRQMVRKMADRAKEKIKDSKEGNKKFLGIG